MFGEGDVFTSWISLFLYGSILLTVIWLFLKFLETKAGKAIEKGTNKTIFPIVRWYEKLPYNFKKVTGWLTLIFYCLCIISLFVWIES